MSDPNQNKPAEPLPLELEEQIQETAEAQASEAEPDDFILRLYKEEEHSLTKQLTLDVSKEEHNRRQRAQWLKEAIDKHALRQRYTTHLFTLTCIWLSFVLLFVGLTGTKGALPIPFHRLASAISLNLDNCLDCWKFYFSLSDKVLIAFITSTTASVIGIFLIVAKWLFPSELAEDKSEKKKENGGT